MLSRKRPTCSPDELSGDSHSRKRSLINRICPLCGAGNMWDHRNGCSVSSMLQQPSRSPHEPIGTSGQMTNASTSVETTVVAPFQTPEANSPPVLTNPSSDDLDIPVRARDESHPDLFYPGVDCLFRPMNQQIRSLVNAVEEMAADLVIMRNLLRGNTTTSAMAPSAATFVRLRTVRTMEEFDNLLFRLEDEHYRRNFIISLSHLCGDEPKISIPWMLSKLISRPLSLHLTWSKGPERRAIQHTRIVGTLEDALRMVTVHASFSRSEVVKAVLDWLRFAQIRNKKM